MTLRELAVLDAMNIATTQYRRRGHDFEATCAEVAETLDTDDRLQEYDLALTTLQVGAVLRRMAQGWPHRREPLVEKIDSRRWHLTDAGVRVLSA